MGASAGTGVRSFAEGGSTSTPTGGTGFGGINPAAINADPRAFGIGPAAESLRQDLAREQAPPRQIYRPQYEDYGLGSTPQAQGRLASILNMGNYGNQMPTFTRPQAPPPQAQYSIPYRTTPDSSFSGLMGSFGRISKNLFGQLIPQAQTGESQRQSIGEGLQRGNLTEAQYNKIMSDPGMYLPYVQYVQAGNDPSGFQRAPTPIQYMTTAQQKAYNKKIKSELDALLRPITVFDVEDQGGGA